MVSPSNQFHNLPIFSSQRSKFLCSLGLKMDKHALSEAFCSSLTLHLKDTFRTQTCSSWFRERPVCRYFMQTLARLRSLLCVLPTAPGGCGCPLSSEGSHWTCQGQLPKRDRVAPHLIRCLEANQSSPLHLVLHTWSCNQSQTDVRKPDLIHSLR